MTINHPDIRRLTWILLLCCSAGLLASSVYRAATFPFTCDESLSYAIFSWAPKWRTSANNHLLNTFMMHRCMHWFGKSELSLRLPNLLAHLGYLACSMLLLKRFRSTVLLAAGFVMLNLNPFMLDFFFLARGYGLALAFMMASLYLLTRAHEEKPQKDFPKFLHLSVLAGALAVLANFSFLNYFLPLLLAGAWLLLSDATLRRFSRGHIPGAAALFAASGIFLAFIFAQLFRLQRAGEFCFGGKTGFITDTAGSLVRCSLYSTAIPPTTEKTIAAIWAGVFVLVLLLGLHLFLLKKKSPLFVMYVLVMAVAVALPILQHRLCNALFPIERAALCYLPLGALVLLSALDWLASHPVRRWEKTAILMFPAALAVILGWHFARSFTTQSCYSWGYDGHLDKVLEIIDQDRKQHFPSRTIVLGNSWKMEPSMNFYRVTRKYTWLAPVTRDPVNGTGYDYIYAFEKEAQALLARPHRILASYSDTKTVLLRLDSAAHP